MQLDAKIWRPFFIGELFVTIRNGLQVPTGAYVKKEALKVGNTPRITVTANNNGVFGFYTSNNKNYKVHENFISVSFLGDCFYHPYEASLDMKVHCLKLLNRELTAPLALFLTRALRQMTAVFNYGDQLSSSDLVSKKIMLPVNECGEPDFDFMATYMRAHEEKILQRYRQFVQAVDAAQVVPLDQKKIWREFNLAAVFDIRATSSGIDKIRLKLGDGELPYITRTDRNNGIQCFVCEQPNYKLDAGNCITVGLDTQTAFYQPTAFYTGQNIQILRNDRLNFHVAQFLLPLIKKTLSIFSWGGNGATLTRLRRSKIMLPVNDDGEPDFDYMAAYVRRTEAEQYRRYLDFKFS